MNKISRVLINVAGIVALSVAPAFAQSSVNLSAHIPFAFHAGTKSLPAGDYRVYEQSGSPNLIVQTADGKALAMILTNNETKFAASGQSKLIFRAYGSQNYLGSIWTAGATSGRKTLKTPAEKESERAGIPMHLAVVELATR